jgi:hypothetical protein
MIGQEEINQHSTIGQNKMNETAFSQREVYKMKKKKGLWVLLRY